MAYAVAALHSLPIGAEVDTSSLADAIGTTISNIISGCGAAVAHGLIVREKVGARYLWRRGPAQIDDAFIQGHPSKNRLSVDTTLRATLSAADAASKSVENGTLSLSERFEAPRVLPDDPGISIVMQARDGIAQDTAIAELCKTKSRVRPATNAPIRCGLFSDGALSIERGGRTETYTTDEVTILVRFLDRMLLRNGSVVS